MNRVDFMKLLKSELIKNKVKGIEEILSDFEDHFTFKLEEGLSEEEIVKKIGNPIEIASDYKNHLEKEVSSTPFVLKLGLAVIDGFMYLFLFFVGMSGVVLSAFALSLVALGCLLVFNLSLFELVPAMPYMSQLLFGIALFGLSLLSIVGVIYVMMYVLQWHRAYQRWRKNVLTNHLYPSLSLHPQLPKKMVTRLKLGNITGTVVFLLMFIIGYIVSAVTAESLQFWHVWEWFVS